MIDKLFLIFLYVVDLLPVKMLSVYRNLKEMNSSAVIIGFSVLYLT